MRTCQLKYWLKVNCIEDSYAPLILMGKFISPWKNIVIDLNYHGFLLHIFNSTKIEQNDIKNKLCALETNLQKHRILALYHYKHRLCRRLFKLVNCFTNILYVQYTIAFSQAILYAMSSMILNCRYNNILL